MDWGLITGLTAMFGVVVNFIRIGRWQGNIETRVEALEKDSNHHGTRLEEIVDLIHKQKDLLTEVKVKLDIMIEEGGSHDGKRHKK